MMFKKKLFLSIFLGLGVFASSAVIATTLTSCSEQPDKYGVIHGKINYTINEEETELCVNGPVDKRTFKARNLIIPNEIEVPSPTRIDQFGKPERIKLPVTEIDAGAFQNTNITGILTLPSSEKFNNIGDFAFCNTNLDGVNLNNNPNFIFVDNLGPDARVVIKSHLPNGKQHDGNFHFLQTDVVAGGLAFGNIEIPGGTPTLWTTANFSGSLINKLVIHNNVTRIEMGTFVSCKKLAVLDFYNSPANMDEYGQSIPVNRNQWTEVFSGIANRGTIISHVGGITSKTLLLDLQKRTPVFTNWDFVEPSKY